jgi:hypothetical protein
MNASFGNQTMEKLENVVDFLRFSIKNSIPTLNWEASTRDISAGTFVLMVAIGAASFRRRKTLRKFVWVPQKSISP